MKPSRRIAISLGSLTIVVAIVACYPWSVTTKFTVINKTGQVLHDVRLRLKDDRTWTIDTLEEGRAEVAMIPASGDVNSLISINLRLVNRDISTMQAPLIFPAIGVFECPSLEMTITGAETPHSRIFHCQVTPAPHRMTTSTLVEDFRRLQYGFRMANRNSSFRVSTEIPKARKP